MIFAIYNIPVIIMTMEKQPVWVFVKKGEDGKNLYVNLVMQRYGILQIGKEQIPDDKESIVVSKADKPDYLDQDFVKAYKEHRGELKTKGQRDHK